MMIKAQIYMTIYVSVLFVYINYIFIKVVKACFARNVEKKFGKGQHFA